MCFRIHAHVNANCLSCSSENVASMSQHGVNQVLLNLVLQPASDISPWWARTGRLVASRLLDRGDSGARQRVLVAWGRLRTQSC